MRTLTAAQEAQRLQDGVYGLWLVVATLDQYGLSSSVVRVGSRAVTVSGNQYQDTLITDGLSLGMTQLSPKGGLASVSGFDLVLWDREGASDVLETHVVANDEVVVYFAFAASTVVDGDRIELARGVIDRAPKKRGQWTIQVKDGSRKDFKQVPTALINPVLYPHAYALGAPLPECFGALEWGPSDDTGSPIALAPCRVLNRFDQTATSSLHRVAAGAPYQWYANAKRFAVLDTYSEAGGIIVVSDTGRTMRLRPSRPYSTNTVTSWRYAADGDTSTSAAVPLSSDKLHLYLSGSPKLGALTGVEVRIVATGTYKAAVYDDIIEVSPQTAYSGDQVIVLDSTTWSDAWDMDLLRVEIEGNGGSGQIKEVWLQIEFVDQALGADEEPAFYQAVQGWADVASYYTDGGVISSAGALLTNPVHQLQALLRGKPFHALPVAQINTASFAAAAPYRSGWRFDWAFDTSRQVSEDQLDGFCFQAGLHLFKRDGAWATVAMDKSRPPTLFYHTVYHTPVEGGTRPPWEYPIDLTQSDASESINEVCVRYAKHPSTGEYQRAAIATGQYRISGTCSTSSSGVLTDASATFVTSGVVARTDDGTGEYIYIRGDIEYEVISVDSETQLHVEATSGGTVTTNVGKPYWLGPNLSGAALRSQEAYKTVNALGTEQNLFTREGGFQSDYIYDDDTASAFVQHVLEWFSNPRFKLSLRLAHDAILLQEGDVFCLDHEEFGQDLRPILATTLSSSASAVDTHLHVASTGPIRVNDYIYIQSSRSSAPEAMKVTTVNYPTKTVLVARAQLGTAAAAHTNGAQIRLLTVKWIAVGVRPPTPTTPYVEVEAEQMPNSYYPVGVVSGAGYPSWTAASGEQRYLSGWSTLRNGRVVDNDAGSALSFVGPTTGRYTIH